MTLSPKTSWCLRGVLLLERSDENKRRRSWGWKQIGLRYFDDERKKMGRWVMERVVVRWRDRGQEDWEVAACASVLFKLLGSLLLLRAENSPQIRLSWVTWERLLWNSVGLISHRRTDTDAPFFFRRDNWHHSISVPMSHFTWLRESLMIPTKRPQKSRHRAGGNRPRKSSYTQNRSIPNEPHRIHPISA